MFKWLAVLAASIALVLGSAACGGGDDEKTIDVGDGNEITVGKDLPDEFPDDFPIYDGADLQGTTRGEQDGITGIVATWTTGDSVDDVVAFYNDAFESGEWSVTLTGNAGGSTYWAVTNSDESKAGYVAIADGDDVLISATVGDNADAGASDDGGDGDDDGSSSDGDSSSDDGDGDAVSDPSDADTGDAPDDANLPDEVDLPEDFPADLVSIPDGARVTSAQSFTSNGQTSYIVSFVTKDSIGEVGDAFESDMDGKGFTQTLKTSGAEGYYAAYTESDDGTGSVVVLSINESTSYDGYQEGVLQITEGA